MPGTHSYQPDEYGLSCVECPFPVGNAIHTQAREEPAYRATADAPRDGATFRPAMDSNRLNAQARRVWKLMESGEWFTLAAIEDATGGTPQASVSARLRDFRKPEFGGHTVESRRTRTGSAWEYRLVVRLMATT